ncbi:MULTISPECIES: hypothetical protein [Aeromonas]|uniref:hypothetical protein n=1 Tax=Aeromonas TaxID=642 RepID=UPI001B3A138E|nr:hypothetical protein [Aeromonas hydrophila]MBQ4675542.1 hypothetical protein [Aeromonas hydrophila]MBW3814699.1 hypothetical protein [Aeromonas hydrophila]MCF7680601.1 hypothetical protein [Aeromonas hydrophila]MCF7693509.1 hypothetical protein [Aeromonas hydrophila]MCF7774380.1 hypothetical protein [Aeromonas hydrophila]
MSNKTPAAHWREKGEPDPHGSYYDCERAKLALGEMTDDELANAVFMHGDGKPSIAEIIAGTAKMPIVYLTAAKERIRWLSRKVEGIKLRQKELISLLADSLDVNKALGFLIESSSNPGKDEALEILGAHVAKCEQAIELEPETQGGAVTESASSKQVAWRMMSGDWREELVSIHGPDGLIASGLTVNQATAIIAAHGGVSDSSQQGGVA